MTWSLCLEALRRSRSGFALVNGVPALTLSSSNAPPFGRTPSGISGGMEAEPGDLVFSAAVFLSWGPGDHFPPGTPGEVGRAIALGGVLLPVDRALEVMWSSKG